MKTKNSLPMILLALGVLTSCVSDDYLDSRERMIAVQSQADEVKAYAYKVLEKAKAGGEEAEQTLGEAKVVLERFDETSLRIGIFKDKKNRSSGG